MTTPSPARSRWLCTLFLSALLALAAACGQSNLDVAGHGIRSLERGQSIREGASRIIAVDERALLIPESAYLEALRRNEVAPATEELARAAVDLAGLANAPGTYGVFGEMVSSEDFFRRGPVPLDTGLYVVVRDAALDADSSQVESTDFYVVAAQLAGTSQWAAKGLSLAAGKPTQFSSGRCCGEARACVPAADGVGLPPQGGGGVERGCSNQGQVRWAISS